MGKSHQPPGLLRFRERGLAGLRRHRLGPGSGRGRNELRGPGSALPVAVRGLEIAQDMEKCGKIWKNTEKYGKIWKNMEKYGKIWKNVEKYGKIWKTMENYGKMMNGDDIHHETCFVCFF